MSDTVKVFEELRETQRETDGRLNQLETNITSTLYMIHPSALTLNNVAIAGGSTLNVVVRGTEGVPSNAKGVFLNIQCTAGGNAAFYFMSSDDPINDTLGNRYYATAAVNNYNMVSPVPLGMDGGFKIYVSGAGGNVTIRLVGYWT